MGKIIGLVTTTVLPLIDFMQPLGGGLNNIASNLSSTIAGGQDNHARGGYDSIGGGWGNETNIGMATIAGGWQMVR